MHKAQLWQHNCMHPFKSVVFLEGTDPHSWSLSAEKVWKGLCKLFLHCLPWVLNSSTKCWEAAIAFPHCFPPLCNIYHRLLGSDARKQGTRNELRTKKVSQQVSLVSVPTLNPITAKAAEGHHHYLSWCSNTYHGRQLHSSLFRTFKPLTPSLRRPLCPVSFPRSCLVAEAE